MNPKQLDLVVVRDHSANITVYSRLPLAVGFIPSTDPLRRHF